jgi:AcrR family transcriptional regulator
MSVMSLRPIIYIGNTLMLSESLEHEDVKILSKQMRSSKSPARTYRMTNRAALVDETRNQIVEAAVHLHGTVGPAYTTVAAIADKAQVTRLTVYRHFPDTDSLFAACTSHWAAQQEFPDLSAWLRVREPRDRLRTGLADLYRFFVDAAPMLTRTTRDWDVLPEFVRERNQQRDRSCAETLLAAWPKRQQTVTRTALVGHAVAFGTWHSLCVDEGMSNPGAVKAMVKLIC